ncbi:hypothetical protein ACWPM1_01895 [Tsuneonella sp. HG249]
MFEAAIMPAVAPTGHELRPLDWGELVARFAAARDLRDLVARPAGEAGSFVSGAAAIRNWDGERPVNLDALGRGKALAAINAGTAGEADVGDQGTR